MADSSASRKSKRGARGAMTLGAVRKGQEGNATIATSRGYAQREPLLQKQHSESEASWDEDVRHCAEHPPLPHFRATANHHVDRSFVATCAHARSLTDLLTYLNPF